MDNWVIQTSTQTPAWKSLIAKQTMRTSIITKLNCAKLKPCVKDIFSAWLGAFQESTTSGPTTSGHVHVWGTRELLLIEEDQLSTSSCRTGFLCSSSRLTPERRRVVEEEERSAIPARPCSCPACEASSWSCCPPAPCSCSSAAPPLGARRCRSLSPGEDTHMMNRRHRSNIPVSVT